MSALYGEPLGEGAFVGGFVVEQLVGEGTTSFVYRASSEEQQPVALKVLRRSFINDTVVLKRMRDEAAATRRFNHPHLIRAVASGDLPDGRPFLALEWLDGETCAAGLEKRGPASEAEVIRVIEGAARGLLELHQVGLVHRDISLSNIMLCRDGRAVLLDFGVAQDKHRSSQLTTTGHVLGTPIMLAPEVLRGAPATTHSDLYALGVVAWTLLHGEAPFEATSTFELSERHLSAALPAWKRADVKWLEPIVSRLMTPNPESRFQNATELLAAIQARQEPLIRLLVSFFPRIQNGASTLTAETWLEAVHQGARDLGLRVEAEGAGARWYVVARTDEATGLEQRLQSWLKTCQDQAPTGVSFSIQIGRH